MGTSACGKVVPGLTTVKLFQQGALGKNLLVVMDQDVGEALPQGDPQ